jgi:hypothetical protein
LIDHAAAIFQRKAAHVQATAELVKQVNREIYWTGWYVCGNNIQWTTANDKKKKQIEQEKT